MLRMLIIGVLLTSLWPAAALAQMELDSNYRFSFESQPLGKPRPVLIDAYHHTIFHPDRKRKPGCEAMLDILNKEYGPAVYLQQAFSEDLLAAYPKSLLIIKGLPNERVELDSTLHYWKSPLAMAEVDAIVRWVADGGQLMLFLSHFPNGSGGKPLLEAFSVKFRDGYVYHEDYPGSRPDSYCSWLAMNAENELINSVHPIFSKGDLRVDTVKLLCGAALFREPADVVLRYPDKAANFSMNLAESDLIAAEQSGQYAAMLAFNFGKGKVIISGDQGLFRNNKMVDKKTGKTTYITINDPEADNAAFLVNILRWLKRGNN